jgi:hypothetical protein
MTCRHDAIQHGRIHGDGGDGGHYRSTPVRPARFPMLGRRAQRERWYPKSRCNQFLLGTIQLRVHARDAAGQLQATTLRAAATLVLNPWRCTVARPPLLCTRIDCRAKSRRFP